MHKYMTDLGLSPASRSRIQSMPTLQPKPWERKPWEDDDDLIARP